MEPGIKCKYHFDFFCIQVVKILADGKVTPCYTVRGTGMFGWCNVIDVMKYSSKTYLAQVTDFDGMTKTEGMEWGFCSYHCSIAARTTMHTTKLVETMVRLENLHLCKEQFQYDDFRVIPNTACSDLLSHPHLQSLMYEPEIELCGGSLVQRRWSKVKPRKISPF